MSKEHCELDSQFLAQDWRIKAEEGDMLCNPL